MFSTIVVGTDGSADAKRAVRVAAALAAADPASEVHVVTAYQPLTAATLRSLSDELPSELRPLLHGHLGADGILSEAQGILQAAGVRGTCHDIDGDPTDAILDAAERTDADLVIVGSRGEGPTKRLLHGSVSTKVLHHAPCAVLVVKEP